MPRPLIKPECDKELLMNLIEQAGFKSARQFAMSIDVTAQSFHNNITGTYGLSIDRIVKIANGLHVPLETIVEVFYPKLYESNKQFR